MSELATESSEYIENKGLRTAGGPAILAAAADNIADCAALASSAVRGPTSRCLYPIDMGIISTTFSSP